MPIKINGTNTAANPSITGSDTDTGIVYGTNQIDFSTGGTSRAAIDGSGHLKFTGTTEEITLQTSDGSDNGYLNLSGGGACSQNRAAQVVMYGNEVTDQQGRLLLMAGNSGNANGVVGFYTGGSERLRIDSSGNVAIGGTTNVTTSLHVENSSGDARLRLRGSINYGVSFTRHSDGALTGYVGSGGSVNLGSSDIALSAPLSGAAIRFQTNGTNSSDEKVRITGDSAPTFLVGQTTADADANGWTLRGAIQASTCCFTSTDVRTFFEFTSYHSTGSKQSKVAFLTDGKIFARTTTIQAYSSERRTKKNIVELDLEKAWNTLRDTPVYTFNYKDEIDGSDFHHGLIVDECPQDLIVPTQQEDEVGIINTINTEKLQYRAYSALQQAIKKIEVLETENAKLQTDLTALTARVAALEAV